MRCQGKKTRPWSSNAKILFISIITERIITVN